MHANGTVAQLGERRTEDAEAAGSSPASPTSKSPALRIALYSNSLTIILWRYYGYL